MGSHSCPLCGKGFASRSYLNRHVLTHSGDGRQFCCQQCDKTFLISSHLADHMRVHSNAYDHLCDVCGKRFLQPKQLRVHAVVHKGVKPYSCDQCDYAAAFLSGLQRHRRKHAAPEQLPHPCADCPRRFLTRQNLQEHRRRRHRRRSATLLLALAAPAPAPAAGDGAAAEEGSEDEDDPAPSPPAGDADSEELASDSRRFSATASHHTDLSSSSGGESPDAADRGAGGGFGLALPPPLARHDAFLEDEDTTSGCHLLENVTLTSAAGREEGDAGGQLLAQPDSPPAGGSLTDQLFAEAAAGVFEAADAGVMVLDERVPMVGVEMELNDQ